MVIKGVRISKKLSVAIGGVLTIVAHAIVVGAWGQTDTLAIMGIALAYIGGQSLVDFGTASNPTETSHTSVTVGTPPSVTTTTTTDNPSLATGATWTVLQPLSQVTPATPPAPPAGATTTPTPAPAPQGTPAPSVATGVKIEAFDAIVSDPVAFPLMAAAEAMNSIARRVHAGTLTTANAQAETAAVLARFPGFAAVLPPSA